MRTKTLKQRQLSAWRGGADVRLLWLMKCVSLDRIWYRHSTLLVSV